MTQKKKYKVKGLPALEQEIERLKIEIEDLTAKPPFSPPAKTVGFSTDQGKLLGLHLRKMIFEDAILFFEHGRPESNE